MDPYATLGLQRGATDEEVKTAFKKLAKTCHPDLHPDDPTAEARFKEINAAYDTIRKGEAEPKQFFRQGAFRFEDIFGHNNPFDDLFGDVRMNMRNMDTHLECRLPLEDAFLGKELNISIPNGRSAPRTVKINIPAGIPDGWRIRMQACGSQTNPNAPPGDLFLTVRVLNQGSRFVREDMHLVTVVSVNAFDVLLGKDVEVTGIDGRTFKVSIPANYDSNQRLRLAGQGMPNHYTGIRGDLLVELFIQYPELTPEQRNLIEQAAAVPKVA